MRALLNLLGLPWWVSLVVVAIFVGIALWQVLTFRRRFERAINESVLEAGSSLGGAAVAVHAVEAVAAPDGPSPYDADEGEEQFMEGVDGEPWDEDGVNFYSLDVTIAPADPETTWDPTALAVVPSDFTPDEPTDLCERMGGLHSAQYVEADGRTRPATECEIRGPRRVKFLFGIPEGIRSVKFALVVTYFGHVELPTPLPRPRRAAARRS